MRTLLTWLLCIVLAVPAVHGGAQAFAPATGKPVLAAAHCGCTEDEQGTCGKARACDPGLACTVRCAVPAGPAMLLGSDMATGVTIKVRVASFAVAAAPPDATASPPFRPPRFPTQF